MQQPFGTQTPRRLLEAPSSRNVTATASIWEPRKRLTCAARLFLPAKVWELGPKDLQGFSGIERDGFFP